MLTFANYHLTQSEAAGNVITQNNSKVLDKLNFGQMVASDKSKGIPKMYQL